MKKDIVNGRVGYNATLLKSCQKGLITGRIASTVNDCGKILLCKIEVFSKKTTKQQKNTINDNTKIRKV